MTSRPVELRSDTFTRPTEAMRRAMYEAEVGDDVWNEDPTVRRLEERAAELMGKDAGLFVVSGTQGNLVGILSHTEPTDEVLVGDQSHVFWYEVGGTAVVGGIQLRTLSNGSRGALDPREVRGAIRGVDIHFPRTGCIALENTHNRCGGSVLRPEEVASVAEVGHAAGVPIHLDGARVLNAAVSLGIPASALTAGVDSVTFALSKGLGAPVGSVLCGSQQFIDKARRWRKLLGGGMRQAGVIAAAGLAALGNIARLAEDHANARILAEGLANVPGVDIDPQQVESNIVVADVSTIGMSTQAFVERLRAENIRIAAVGPSTVRAVTSYEVSRGDVEYALEVIGRAVKSPVPSGA